MRSFSHWIITLFATPLGVLVLAALDSTLFFSLPFGIDAAVILLAAQLHGLWWTVPLLATLGSVAGAWLTFWMGRTIGEKGLERFVSPTRLRRIQHRVHTSGTVALAALDLVPPPFPFTPFILAAGALEVSSQTFFITLTVCRILRFGLEATLGAIYGRRIVGWLNTDLFHDVVSGCIVIAIALTTLSIVRLVRSTRRPAKRRAAA
jgi:membrane protein YqaA with SNARE-associated domain